MAAVESKTRSLLEQDDAAALSTFRRTNKILILTFLSLIFSLAIIIASLIIYLVHNDQSPPPDDQIRLIPNPAVHAYYPIACNTPSCRKSLSPVINDKSITDPNQIFTLSLQTAVELLHNITATLSTSSNCSSYLRHATRQINQVLSRMRVDPFVESLTDAQRNRLMNWIQISEEDLELCVDDLEINAESSAVLRARVGEVGVYVGSSGDFLMSYDAVIQAYESDSFAGDPRGFISSDYLFIACVGGLQLSFMLFMFCSLFRVR